MRVLSKKITAIALATVIALGAAGGTTASAKELPQSNIVTETNSEVATPEARMTCQISPNAYTLVYTGQGATKWLNINPHREPMQLTIRMIDYNGITVHEESFTSIHNTRWLVGANVHYVYLKGGPVTVDISVSDR